MNITNRTPLAGVKLFESKTYPDQGIDLYWRNHSPISFELSDSPDRGDAYPHFLAHVSSLITSLDTKSYFHEDHYVLTAKVTLENGRCFFVIQDDDIVTLMTQPPILTEEFKSEPLSIYVGDAFEASIKEALLVTTFSPVDLAWLCGKFGRTVGLYDSAIWGAAVRRLPDDSFFRSDWDSCCDLRGTEVVANDVHPCCA